MKTIAEHEQDYNDAPFHHAPHLGHIPKWSELTEEQKRLWIESEETDDS